MIKMIVEQSLIELNTKNQEVQFHFYYSIIFNFEEIFLNKDHLILDIILKIFAYHQ